MNKILHLVDNLKIMTCLQFGVMNCFSRLTSLAYLDLCPEQKQPLRGVFSKRCSENMQQIYRRTPMAKCDFVKVALHKFSGEHPCRSVISIKLLIEITLRHGCFPLNLLHIFRTPFTRNTSEWPLLPERLIKRSFRKHPPFVYCKNSRKTSLVS